MSLLATKAKLILDLKPYDNDRPKSSNALLNFAKKVNNASFEKKYNLKRLNDKWNRKIKLNFSFYHEKYPYKRMNDDIKKSKENMRLLTTPDILCLRKKQWDPSVSVSLRKLSPYQTSILSHKSIFDYDGYLYKRKKESNSEGKKEKEIKRNEPKNITKASVAVVRSNLRPVSQQKPHISTKEFIMKLCIVNQEHHKTKNGVKENQVEKKKNDKKIGSKDKNIKSHQQVSNSNTNKLKRDNESNNDDHSDSMSFPKIMRSSTMGWISHVKPKMSLIRIHRGSDFIISPNIFKEQNIKHVSTEVNPIYNNKNKIIDNKPKSKSTDNKQNNPNQVSFSLHNNKQQKSKPKNKAKGHPKLKIPIPKAKKKCKTEQTITDDQKLKNVIEARLSRKSLYQKEINLKLFNMKYTTQHIHPGIYRQFTETNSNNSQLMTTFMAWSCCLNESKSSEGCSKLIEKRNPTQ